MGHGRIVRASTWILEKTEQCRFSTLESGHSITWCERVRFNGNDKNVVLYWNTFGVFYLAWGDHVREMGHVEDTLEGLRLMAWTFQALG